MWAVGCILAEMTSLESRPLFPGTSTMNQLDKILEVTGYPSREQVESLQSPFAMTMLESVPPGRHRPIPEMFPHASPEVLDFMRGCLVLNPQERMTVDVAIRHPLVAQFHASDGANLVAPGVISIVMSDNTKLKAEDYRTKLYQEIVKKKKDASRRVAEAQLKEKKVLAGATTTSAGVSPTNTTTTAAAGTSSSSS